MRFTVVWLRCWLHYIQGHMSCCHTTTEWRWKFPAGCYCCDVLRVLTSVPRQWQLGRAFCRHLKNKLGKPIKVIQGCNLIYTKDIASIQKSSVFCYILLFQHQFNVVWPLEHVMVSNKHFSNRRNLCTSNYHVTYGANTTIVLYYTKHQLKFVPIDVNV